jgi:diguanylate cyclase (GGDEF)-like protein/PAS domain S-box-containing protein
MKRHLSIRLLLMAILPLFVSVILLGLALSTFSRMRQVVVDVQEEDMHQLLALASSSINQLWIAPRAYAVSALSRSPTLATQIAEGGQRDALFQEWDAARSVMEGAFFIYYALEDGTILHYPPDPLPEGFDPRSRPWYRAGITSPGGVTWSPPYREVITGETLVSAVMPITDDSGARIGVFSTDVVVNALEASLEGIQLPAEGEVFLLGRDGAPFVGTNDDVVETAELPEPTDELIVDTGPPLSSGWKLAVVVPRQSLADRFARVRQPLILSFILVVGVSTLAISWLIGGVVYRTRHLAKYFQEVTTGNAPLRSIFKTEDEFHYLNEQFNSVILSARHAQEEKLSQERVFRLLVERAPIGFFRTRRDGSVTYANEHFARLLGKGRDELLRLPSIGLLYKNRDDRKRFLAELETNQEVRDRRIQFVKDTDTLLWLSINAFLAPAPEGDSEPHIEGFVVDVTADVAERENLKRLSETDPLTDIANRRSFDAAAERLVERGGRLGESVGLIVFDIDHFKHLNDTYGHDTGDAALRSVAAIGSGILRKSDLFARIGGDEFAILLPGATEDDAYALGVKLHQKVETAHHSAELPTTLTVSVGVGGYSGGDITVGELITSADTALYAAKNAGRNCVRRASSLHDS